MRTFERLLPNEDRDIADVVAGILHAQATTARQQHRGLARGTHAKGVCVRGTFEVLDLAATIADPTLRMRLAHGLFARPGVYPATIRFANANKRIQSDAKRDVRALSFAVALPPGVLGRDATRHDFSLNSATTFPINDVHAFALFTRVLEAEGVGGTARALASFSARDWGSFVMSGVRGARQVLQTVQPYQRLRYWSNVPFRHGPDEAVKYSLTALPANAARTPDDGPDALRDALADQLGPAARPVAFEFGIQLLDTERMRHRGRRRDAIYWVENAAVEWPEDAAPFHPVGRLTLDHGAPLSDAQAAAFYIDVTEYATPESQGLGSLNRARWFAEAASRKVRLGEAGAAATDVHVAPAARTVGASGLAFGTPPGAPLPAPPRRLRVRGLAIAAVVALAAVGVHVAGAKYATARMGSASGMLPPERVDSVVYADRGWGVGVDAPRRQAFYYTPQGAGLKGVRYRWFVNLETPWGRDRLTDPGVLRRYGFLVDPATSRNPDRLPVGFTRHYDVGRNEEMLDVTCAACHTGQIEVIDPARHRRMALRIDGGQANHALTSSRMGQFLPTLTVSLLATATNPFKFDRFARKVVGDSYGAGQALALERELYSVIGTLGRLAWYERRDHLVPTEEGFGRTDALARISNTVFGEHLTTANFVQGSAPVNYPPLWNAWKLNWVQYNASVSQPMARNLGEALGVGAQYALVDAYGAPLPPAQRFRSTALVDSLDAIERTLWMLHPPAWDETVLGPRNDTLADRGRTLFVQHCEGCHGPHLAPETRRAVDAPLKHGPGQPEWLVKTLCVDDIGTDPTAARNFASAIVDVRRTGLTAADLRDVARRTEERWATRWVTYLSGEITRLSRSHDPDSIGLARQYGRDLQDVQREIEQRLQAIDPARVPMGAALSYVGTLIREKTYADRGYTPAEQDMLDGFGALDRPQIVAAYKARPLAGIWATPPFLHNGSVPTIYDLLSPAAARPRRFQVGSREYDTHKLGLAQVSGFREFDTSLPGNHNTGHEFSEDYDVALGSRQRRDGLIGPYLPPADRWAILEYLKRRDDDADGPKQPSVPHGCEASPPVSTTRISRGTGRPRAG